MEKAFEFGGVYQKAAQGLQAAIGESHVIMLLSSPASSFGLRAMGRLVADGGSQYDHSLGVGDPASCEGPGRLCIVVAQLCP